jgi:hypothetical protein
MEFFSFARGKHADGPLLASCIREGKGRGLQQTVFQQTVLPHWRTAPI